MQLHLMPTGILFRATRVTLTELLLAQGRGTFPLSTGTLLQLTRELALPA